MIGTKKLKKETGKREQPKMLRKIEEARTSESVKASASAHTMAAVKRFVEKIHDSTHRSQSNHRCDTHM